MPLPMPTIIPSLVDELEQLFFEELKCNSSAKHDCTITAVAICTSQCNDDTKYWCSRRYEMYLEIRGDYSIVCSACGDPIPKDWRVFSF